MPEYAGKTCRIAFDEENCTITPGLSFDLGDIDRIEPGEWEMRLTLYTGRTIELRQFGSAFSNMQSDLIAAWRDRTVQCLLLEDLEEVERYDAAANGVRGQVRLYSTNLAALPLSADPIQLRLAEVDAVRFDEATYTVVLETSEGRVEISKLGKKTEDFQAKLGECLDALRARSGRLREGRSYPASEPPEGSVDDELRPYFDELRKRAVGEWSCGFKFTGPEERFFWFFFPLKGAIAWEATTGTGRATYFFKPDSKVDQLTRGLALVNFRREPVYLPDSSLAEQPKFRRYAIGARKLKDLRALRSAYLGRAIHSSLEEWMEHPALNGGG